MKYGFFNDKSKEYVINTPATPLPWINYLGSNGFYSLISNTGGGYSFYQDAKLRRITRYRYNNVPTDLGGRCCYIKDSETVWSPGFLPCKTELDHYSCRHGLGYTVISGEKNGVCAEMTCFVPIGKHCEINRLSIKNTTNKQKNIQLFNAIEWCLWNAQDDAQNFQRNLFVGDVEVDETAIYHKSEYRERRNHFAFFSTSKKSNGFETDRETFLGRFGSWEYPAAVQNGKCLNSVASGLSPIACHQYDLTLAPGEEKTFIFILGYVENAPDEKWESKGVINKTAAKKIIAQYSSDQQVQTALEKLAQYWADLLGHFSIKSDNKKIDRMVNVWNQYQCMVTFNISRSASYFESGISRGMGFRDSCQDLLGFVHMVPARARLRILDLAAIQFENGSTYHQYQPLTGQGNADIGSGFNDDPLWLVACTAAFIRETGDDSILNEPVPFNNVKGSEKSLFEHLRRSVTYTATHLGPHGLPLIGRADWNDCLNLNCYSKTPGESFQTCDNIDSGTAESVFIAVMFVKYGTEYADLCSYYGDKDEANTVLKNVDGVRQAILDHAWDGEWFLRAYDTKGNKVGSHECKEGQIYVEPQGFAAMAGVGVEEGLVHKALASVRSRLLNDYGIELLSPCYSEYYLELGEISSYPPGNKENGSVTCHNNPWISIAETVVGNSENAFDVYRRTCPAYVEKHSDIRKTEPYVYTQTIPGRESKRYGEAKSSWLTGTAAWAFVNISQAILGIKPHYNGLIIDPCVPEDLGEYRIERKFRGVKYTIIVHNTGTGSKTLKVDGELIDGNLILHQQHKTHVTIELDM